MPDTNMKVLIVDDAVAVRRIVISVMKGLGFKHLEEAENGQEAFEKLKGGGYHFAIVDWNMPILTGIELVHKIKADASLKDLKILMVTAEAEQEKVIEAIKAGVNNYIVKPFTPGTLEEKVNKIFP